MQKKLLEELLMARTAAEYAEAAVLSREVFKEMLARLDWMTLKPRIIVDVGCAVGDGARMLYKRYPDAKVIAIDSSDSLLTFAKKEITSIEWLRADLSALSLPDHSVDLITANLTIPWCEDLSLLLREWRRILRPDGLLMLTALGPDTLRELHDLPLAFPQLMDMHTVGDLLIHAGFIDPVLDVDYFNVTYRDVGKLWRELKVTGMIAGDTDAIELKFAEEYPLSYEIIFGHAFGPGMNANHKMNESGEVRIPVSHLLRR